MVTNDATLVRLKHRIMEETAKLAWDGNLDEEHKEQLIYEIIPGPMATYRCCVYKERELVKQRINLSLAKCPDGISQSENIVQVIRPACEECPLSAYTVTDNCRLCMGKACINSCKFGAISIGERRTHIDPNKCKECGMCAKACPYGAIAHLVRPCKKACPVGAITYDDNGICVIDENKCIQCGHCIHSCPFGAIGSKTYLVNIINDIRAGKEVIAMVAPATEGQFGADITMKSIKEAFIKMGFADMVEVGLGGDMTAAYESIEWAEAKEEGKKMTTSCCPAFMNMIKKHFPKQYAENVSQTVSPMCAISRYLKATHPGCVTVFLGPCIAKKSEAADKSIPGNADYVITYGEFRALMRSKGVEVQAEDNSYQESSIWGKRFATSGGVANAVLECMQERGQDTSGITYVQVAGGLECKTTLTMLKANRLKEDFVEGMICEGGCVGGPSKHRTEMEIKRAREGLLKKADGRKVLDNLKNYPMDKFSMYRDGHMDEECLIEINK
ncbi:MAG: 4Fe-4S dicluster domain-containing protein [Lachnospiraceae bacterium]|nr:4Fe-4S dicluster domain-containing protein [Lachnospiraceae bacterium]